MDVPQVRYARVGEQYVAYQVFGDGPIELLIAPPVTSNVEVIWEDSRYTRFMERLSSFARIAVFDKRGTGLSDPILGTGVPTLEERMDDMRAVMTAAGFEMPALFGFAEGGPLTILFAATYPDKVSQLVLFNTTPRILRSDDYPWGWDPGDTPMDDSVQMWEAPPEDVEEFMKRFSPGLAGEPDWKHFVRWQSRFERLSASPGLYAALRLAALQIDVRDVLQSVQCPTLVLHRVDDVIVTAGNGRYIADHIRGAEYVELPGGDHWPWNHDGDRVVAELQEFLTGERPTPEVDRVLCTVLFTDLVGSTEMAVRLGDARWREVLAQHHTIVRRELARHRGHEVDNAGDGFLATFDGPARAIRCAEGVHRDLHGIGLEVRAGVHTGECEIVGDKIAGLAVHIAARIASSASAGEILVSRTVKDLVAGSGIAFEDRGVHALKGVPEEWQLYAARL